MDGDGGPQGLVEAAGVVRREDFGSFLSVVSAALDWRIARNTRTWAMVKAGSTRVEDAAEGAACVAQGSNAVVVGQPRALCVVGRGGKRRRVAPAALPHNNTFTELAATDAFTDSSPLPALLSFTAVPCARLTVP